jgi:hypothetical protein
MATPSDPRGGPPEVPPQPPHGPAGPPGPAGQYGQQPRPAQPRKPASPVLQQRAFAAPMLAIISLLGMSEIGGDIRRGVVVLAVAVVIGVVGLWLSFTAMSRSRKAGTVRPRFAVAATVIGFIGSGLSTLALIGFALFWPQVSQYANCISGANTVATQNACNQQLNNSLQTSMQLLGR